MDGCDDVDVAAAVPSPDRLVDAGLDDDDVAGGFTDTDDADAQPELAFGWSDGVAAASAAAEAEATDDAAALFGLGAPAAGYSDDDVQEDDEDDDAVFDVYCANALHCDGYYLTAATAVMPDAFFALGAHDLN